MKACELALHPFGQGLCRPSMGHLGLRLVGLRGNQPYACLNPSYILPHKGLAFKPSHEMTLSLAKVPQIDRLPWLLGQASLWQIVVWQVSWLELNKSHHDHHLIQYSWSRYLFNIWILHKLKSKHFFFHTPKIPRAFHSFPLDFFPIDVSIEIVISRFIPTS